MKHKHKLGPKALIRDDATVGTFNRTGARRVISNYATCKCGDVMIEQICTPVTPTRKAKGSKGAGQNHRRV